MTFCVCRTMSSQSLSKGLSAPFPPETAQDAVESIQLAFEDALDELNYEDNPHIDLFHDVTYAFFREKER